jgi:hypothetical protein
MLKELSHYENLGTPQYFWELFDTLKKSNRTWTIKEVQEYFFNRVVDKRSIFDGCILFAKLLGIVKINRSKEIILNNSFLDSLKSQQYLNEKIIEIIFQKLKNDEVFCEIFCSQNISYDVFYHLIQISNSAFRFKYANFKQLLVDFGFLLFHPNKQINAFVINSKYKKVFDKVVLPEIKKRKIGIRELKKTLEQQQIYGEEAERFVLCFEGQRLKNRENIDWVAEYWVNAGYDIASYEGIESVNHDRFIEVKSYSGTPSFFWSRNEIETAHIKKEQYFLYLVDRSKINLKDYAPMIIQNPCAEVLQNNTKWNKRVEKYFLSACINA